MRTLAFLVTLTLLIGIAACVDTVPTDTTNTEPDDPIGEAEPNDEQSPTPDDNEEDAYEPSPTPDDNEPGPSDVADTFTLFVDGSSSSCSDAYSREENSLSRPFCSIQHAADIVVPGDAVRIESGVYEERVVMTQPGSVDAPIVFSGVRADDGSWLTHIEGGTAATGWVRAPEMDPNGYGVYKTTLDFRPYSMTADERMLVHLLPSNNDWLAFSPDHIHREQVRFWDGIEGVYGHDTATGETYVRFRNGDDPNDMRMYAAPNEAAIHVRDAGFIEMRDLSVTNARHAIRVSGDANGVTIENNLLTNSESRIIVDDGAADTTIRGNEILIHSLSDEFTQGPWSDITLLDHSGDVYYQLEVQEQLYRTVHKGNEALTGWGIEVSGEGHVIEDNLIGNAINAISIRESHGVTIRSNTLENSSSVGFLMWPGAQDVRIYENTVRNVNIPLRFMKLHDAPAQSVHFYNNRASAEPRAGKAAYFHEGFCRGRTLDPDHEIWIYHNSFSGNGVGLQSGCSERTDSGLAGLRVVNNVVSGTRSFEFSGDWRTEGYVGGVDHNWFLTSPGSAPWLGDQNIVAARSNDWMWSANDRDLVLPTGSPARNEGLDLSEPFVLNGETFDPLPGMEPGYFSGDAPNMGAVQD